MYINTYPIWYVTLHFRDQSGVAASLRCRNRAEITVLICELRPYPVWFSCQCKSCYPVQSKHSLPLPSNKLILFRRWGGCTQGRLFQGYFHLFRKEWPAPGTSSPYSYCSFLSMHEPSVGTDRYLRDSRAISFAFRGEFSFWAEAYNPCFGG